MFWVSVFLVFGDSELMESEEFEVEGELGLVAREAMFGLPSEDVKICLAVCLVLAI